MFCGIGLVILPVLMSSSSSATGAKVSLQLNSRQTARRCPCHSFPFLQRTICRGLPQLHDQSHGVFPFLRVGLKVAMLFWFVVDDDVG